MRTGLTSGTCGQCGTFRSLVGAMRTGKDELGRFVNGPFRSLVGAMRTKDQDKLPAEAFWFRSLVGAMRTSCVSARVWTHP